MQPELRQLRRRGTAGGTYTAPAGVSITAATGDIDLATSTPGTYVITYPVSQTALVVISQRLILQSRSMHFRLQRYHIQVHLIVQPVQQQ